MKTLEVTPPRFEDIDPEASQAFMKLCQERAKQKASGVKLKPIFLNSINPFGLPIQNETPKVGRNDPCPCGSGKKFKKCCAK